MLVTIFWKVEKGLRMPPWVIHESVYYSTYDVELHYLLYLEK